MKIQLVKKIDNQSKQTVEKYVCTYLTKSLQHFFLRETKIQLLGKKTMFFF